MLFEWENEEKEQYALEGKSFFLSITYTRQACIQPRIHLQTNRRIDEQTSRQTNELPTLEEEGKKTLIFSPAIKSIEIDT